MTDTTAIPDRIVCLTIYEQISAHQHDQRRDIHKRNHALSQLTYTKLTDN